jgi:hypothetical protein
MRTHSLNGTALMRIQQSVNAAASAWLLKPAANRDHLPIIKLTVIVVSTSTGSPLSSVGW